MFKSLNWEGKGVCVNGKYINNLRLSDDLVIIAKEEEELTDMLEELNEEGKKKDLEVSIEKTKIMSTEEMEREIKIEGKTLEKVEEVIYLGQTIAITKGTEREVNRGIALTWKKYWSLKHIMKGPYKNEHKSEIFNGCVVPTLTYGAQTWAMTKREEEKNQSNSKCNGEVNVRSETEG